MIKQLHASLVPPADYIQAHPELRPHIWKGPDVIFRLDGPDWLNGLAGVVVYQCTTDPTDLRITPRALRLSHIPGFFTPPEMFFDKLAGTAEEGGREYRVIDWIELDPKYAQDSRLDPQLAAIFTLRAAFAMKWNDLDRLFDIYWQDSKHLWDKDPFVNWPSVEPKKAPTCAVCGGPPGDPKLIQKDPELKGRSPMVRCPFCATSSRPPAAAADTPSPQTQPPEPPSPSPAASSETAAASPSGESAPQGSPEAPQDPSRPPEASSGPDPGPSASG